MEKISENEVQNLMTKLNRPTQNEQRIYEFADLVVYINDFTFSDNSMLRMIGTTTVTGTTFEYYIL